jgi:hypothetical protein
MIQIQEDWLQMKSDDPVILQPGDYPFKVKQAEPQISKNGNDMIVLQIIVKGSQTTTTVYDYLIGKRTCFWKIKNFCNSVGISSVLVADGQLAPADCVDRVGTVRLTIEPAKDGYPEKNTVDDYVISTFSEEEPDDIPF